MSQFREGFLNGMAKSSEKPQELLQENYDLVIVTSSWDQRSICIPNAGGVRAEYGIVLYFTKRDQKGLRDKHDEILKQYVASNCRQHVAIQGDSLDYHSVWSELEAEVLRIYSDKERPLRILMDLSTCPRYLSLGLLANGMLMGLTSHLSYFYAEGAYPEEVNAEDKYDMFTGGGWQVTAIPGLEGEWDPVKKRVYIVSVGFEGSKTLRLLSRAEPDRVAILFPDPGVKPEYVQRTYVNNKAVLDAFRIPETDIVRAPAGNAIEAWRALSHAKPEAWATENIYYVCCGTKPHSLALGLRALAMRSAAVLYIAPELHRVVDIRPLGIYWRYDVIDTSSLIAHTSDIRTQQYGDEP